MKTCTKCGEAKSLEDFYRDKGSSTGRRADCKACFYAFRAGGRYRERYKRWWAQNPRRNLNYALTRKYGITVETYEIMLAEQEGKCRICGTSERLCVDHDHDTGHVRGLLCPRCNIGMGFYDAGFFADAKVYAGAKLQRVTA
jgi:hypothetical protein